MVTRTLQPTPGLAALRASLDPRVLQACALVEGAGGRALLVGGFVRDLRLGIDSKDIDIEVFGLDFDALSDALSALGTVKEVGRAFGVLRVSDLDADFALARRDSKFGPGHKGFTVEFDPHLDAVDAARRRDLTINAMSIDPLTAEFIDPLHGLADLEAGVLRACDAKRFGEDPLRAMRVAQFAARFEMNPDPELLWICHDQDLSELSGERMFEELRKMLLKGVTPSVGLELLERTGLLRFFPELNALVGIPQDPHWHPEGDVWTHTLMVIDEAARLRLADTGADTLSAREIRNEDEALMFAALCHDLGKAVTTLSEGGRIRSPGHDVAGDPLVERFFARLGAPRTLTTRVQGLTRNHLAPAMLFEQHSTDRAYRRLARRLAGFGVSMLLLERVARADHLGRTTDEALAREFPAGDHFVARARELQIESEAQKDVVLGRHLVARGYTPGPEFAELLRRCREVQDETGEVGADVILDSVLGERA
jgi:tRNA nucleotidyltransferase (CCA-adding enzyme)